jgi:uncharacterized repeat protein (TIGR02543 family)
MDGVEHYYLYGVWAPLYWFDVFLDVNGGVSSSGNTSGLNCSYSSESQKTYFVFPDETPTRKDHRFLGWATSPSATTAEYHAGDKIELVGTLEGEEANWHNFYAVWVTTYTVHVKYDANGGTGGPIEGIFTNDNSSEVTITISDTFPTLAEYSFLGWSTKKSDTSPLYYSSKKYSINVDTGYTKELILYAIWKERIKGNYAYIVIKENASPAEAIPYIYNGTKWV